MRFDEAEHAYYTDAGLRVPSITQLLERAGVVNDLWFTEESSARGTAVHALTAQFDLGALDPADCVSKFRGYLLAYCAATNILKLADGLQILTVEEPAIHPTLGFGGRPDRTIVLQKKHALHGVLEVKSGAPMKSHPIQTALQSLLVADGMRLPPESLARFCLYIRDKGKFTLIEHRERRDFDEARRIVRTCCGS